MQNQMESRMVTGHTGVKYGFAFSSVDEPGKVTIYNTFDTVSTAKNNVILL